MALPAWASRTGFRLLDPVKSLRSRIEFILQLHDREALLPREGQRRFLEADGWVAWPGPAMADFLRQFIAHNRMLEGGFVIEDRLRHARRHRAARSWPSWAPSTRSRPRAGVRAIRSGGAASRRLRARAHAPATSGSSSARRRHTVTWPTVAAWARWRAGEGELPEHVTPVPEDAATELAPAGRAAASATGVELAGGVGAGMARSAARHRRAGRRAACAS